MSIVRVRRPTLLFGNENAAPAADKFAEILKTYGLKVFYDEFTAPPAGEAALHMSPEQAEGQAIDHRSDLFSLGTISKLV